MLNIMCYIKLSSIVIAMAITPFKENANCFPTQNVVIESASDKTKNVVVNKSSDKQNDTIDNSLNDYVENNIAYVKEIIDLTNKEREKYQLPNLSYDEELTVIAMKRAIEIAENNSFSHTRPNGLAWYSIFDGTQYETLLVGENLSKKYNTPEQAVNAWMQSETHKENILYPDYHKIGVGYAISEDGNIYFVQEFSE